MKKESVGLLILTKIEEFGWVSILRRRGWLSRERMSSHYFPGVCQVTVHAKCEKGENALQALTRETVEELGNDFANDFDLPTISNRLTELNRIETDKEIFITYGIIVNFSAVVKIRLDNPFDRLEILTRGRAFGGCVRSVHRGDRKHGIQNMNMIAMFPDEEQAVISAFEKMIPR